jgi:peptidyl-prolyl cis-trans isomerase D
MMMREMREKTKIIMIVVALCFVGLMVFEWGMDISGSSVAQQTGELGRVNGEPVSLEEYNFTYQQFYDRARLQMGSSQLTREQIREIEDAAFTEVVNNILLRQEIERRGLRATDREVQQAAQWMPHPELMQNELFLTDGQFDINKYQQFLTGPTVNEDLLLTLEAYYRDAIPRSKLMRQIAAGVYPSDSQLWELWRDQNETVTVDYVPLNVATLVPGEVDVTSAEIRDYYEEHEEEFERPEAARVKVASISKVPSRADSVAAMNRAQAVRQEILAGADFAEVAARESADEASRNNGGELGTFGRGDMVAEFENAAFTLPIGELSAPVPSDYGFHLIEVQARDSATATARHILISYEPTDEALDDLYTRADSMEVLAESQGVERAARVVNATVRDGIVISMDQPYIPGVGSAVEALEWARDEQVEDDPLTVSPVFETPESFYVVEVQQFTPAGRLSLEQATPEIRRLVTLEKKREQARQIGQAMVEEVRGGKPLEQVATERNLSVERTGPFTRGSFNAAFGQANAATGASFGTPVGQVSDVVSTPGGLFIIRPVQRSSITRADFEAGKEAIRQFAIGQMQQQALARWLDSVRREADIVDRRRELEAANAAAARNPIGL